MIVHLDEEPGSVLDTPEARAIMAMMTDVNGIFHGKDINLVVTTQIQMLASTMLQVLSKESAAACVADVRKLLEFVEEQIGEKAPPPEQIQ
jgi:hypothetical protein